MDLRSAAAQAARKYGIPEGIFFGLIQAESSWNPKATSRVGAMGLTQVMPNTARGMGYDPNQLKNDPMLQLEAGAKYLSQMYRQFGDWTLALAAYNAGPGNVQKYGGVPPFKETQNYVRKVMGSAGDVASSQKSGTTQRPTDTMSRGTVGTSATRSVGRTPSFLSDEAPPSEGTRRMAVNPILDRLPLMPGERAPLPGEEEQPPQRTGLTQLPSELLDALLRRGGY